MFGQNIFTIRRFSPPTIDPCTGKPASGFVIYCEEGTVITGYKAKTTNHMSVPCKEHTNILEFISKIAPMSNCHFGHFMQ